MIGNEEIQKRFGYHKGTDVTMPQHQIVRAKHMELAYAMDALIPDGRCKSLAFTALQEAAMWANCAVAEQAPLVNE